MVVTRRALTLVSLTAVALVGSIASVLLLLFTSPATAGGNNNALKLEYVLSGPAIGGAVPSGKAVIDQPRLPGALTCEVQNLNLPDGTVLDVSVNFYEAGTLTIVGRKGRMTASIPFQVRTGPFEILLDDEVIMTGRWKT